MWLCNCFNRKVCSYNIQYLNPTQNPKFLVKPDPKAKSPTRQSLAPGKVQRAAGKEQRAHAWKQSAEVKIDKITTEILFYIISLFFLPQSDKTKLTSWGRWKRNCKNSWKTMENGPDLPSRGLFKNSLKNTSCLDIYSFVVPVNILKQGLKNL